MAVRWALVPAFVGSVGLATVGSQSSTYFVRSISIADLGTLGGAEAFARDINGLGEVVGWSTGPGGGSRAFLYRDARMRDVTAGLDGHDTDAWGINDSSEIVGTAVRHTDRHSRAFSAPGGDPARLAFLPAAPEAVLPPGCRWESAARAIAGTGHIVGIVWLSSAIEPRPPACGGGAAPVEWRSPDARVQWIPGTGAYDAWVWGRERRR
jgi:probable HAF family extracellular repeat protein